MLLNAAAEIAIHVLWFYFMGSSVLTSRDVDTVVPILLVPLIALTEFFLVIRTPSRDLINRYSKLIQATFCAVLVAFLFGLSPADTISFKTLTWSLLMAQRIILADRPLSDIPFIQKWHDRKAIKSEEIVPVLCVLGCWCASLVIPLDWERSWQKWPIPNVIGCEVGYLLGRCIIIGEYLLFKSRGGSDSDKKIQ